MKTIVIFNISFIMCTNLFAQNNKEVYNLKSGANITETIPYRERYQFAEFLEGKVYFRNGRTTKAKLNYSIFDGEIQFINSYKDTLLLADNRFVNRITIADNIFYHSERYGHIQQIKDYQQIKLGKKLIFEIMGKGKYTAHEQYSATSSISNLSYFANSRGEYQYLQSNEKFVMSKRSLYFLIDKNQRISIANKANLIKIFPDDRKALSDCIKKTNTDFGREEDLTAILKFCGSL